VAIRQKAVDMVSHSFALEKRPIMIISTLISPIILLILLSSTKSVSALRYFPEDADYNLNQNQSATEVLDFWGEWGSNHQYNPSPKNWRFPFYSMCLPSMFFVLMDIILYWD
jgi:hypothetical protein